ncbi:MAG: hypothetical protein LC687_01005 [Actinobacteria bacterium]|nr:hypothetical protein [Actinomycetota bacterium]
MFETDNDYMEVGELIPIDGEWFYDTESGTKFRLNDDGDLVDEEGNVITPGDPDDDFMKGFEIDDSGYYFED